MVIRVFEFAKRKRDLSDWIEDKTLSVIDALAQLYAFPNTQYVNHWRKEVWSNFNRVKRLSGRKKIPSKKFILDSSWEINKDYTDICLDSMIQKESELTPRSEIDYSEFYEKVESYFDWLAEILSKKMIVSPNEVYAELENLDL